MEDSHREFLVSSQSQFLRYETGKLFLFLIWGCTDPTIQLRKRIEQWGRESNFIIMFIMRRDALYGNICAKNVHSVPEVEYRWVRAVSWLILNFWEAFKHHFHVRTEVLNLNLISAQNFFAPVRKFPNYEKNGDSADFMWVRFHTPKNKTCANFRSLILSKRLCVQHLQFRGLERIANASI